MLCIASVAGCLYRPFEPPGAQSGLSKSSGLSSRRYGFESRRAYFTTAGHSRHSPHAAHAEREAPSIAIDPTESHVFVSHPPGEGDPDAGRLRAYAVADSHARFRRARGEEAGLMLALDEPEAPRRLESLAIAVDDERSLALDDPLVREWSERLIERLAAADLLYERGGQRFLRASAFAEENDRRLAELDGWTDAAFASQRDLLRRIDGIEVEGQALDGTPLTLFTPHPDAIAAAEFVGLSPQRPEVDAWLGDEQVRRGIEQLRGGDWSGRPLEQLPAVDIGVSAQVPGVAQPLPILVSPSVDARFGPTATVGAPSVDAADEALARNLPKLGGLAWKADVKPPTTTPATRFLAADMPLSEGAGSGAANSSEGTDSSHGDATRRFAAAWIELALAVPPAERDGAVGNAAKLAERLPLAQTVAAPGSAQALLDMRTVAKALRDAGALDLPDGEPLGPTLLCAPLALAGDSALDDPIEAHGADAVRFALLYGAAPEKEVAIGDAAVRHCASRLADLRSFAEPRLASAAAQAGAPATEAAAANGAQPAEAPGARALDARIDMGDGLRRRLAGWCDTAVERSAENHERLDSHRATRNALELLARIQDFERRATEYRGDLAGPDADALAIALSVLVRLLAPLAPALADELWRAAGHPGAVADAPWPARQRQPTAA